MYIYKITNKINNMVYIGQTTRDYLLRFKEHKESALYDKTKNTYLYKAMRFYKIENFCFEILEQCISIEELNTKEKLYIKQYNSLMPNGYNYLVGGLNKYNLTENHILKLSKPIMAYDEQNTFYFISLSNTKKLGYSPSTIHGAIKQNRKYRGYFWKYISVEQYLLNKHKNNIIKKSKIYCYAKSINTNEILTFSCIKELAKYNFQGSKVSACLNKYKRYRSHKGYIFSKNLNDLFYTKSKTGPKKNPAQNIPS